MANPILSRVELTASSTPLSVQGVVRKTTFLLTLTALMGLGFFFYGGQLGLTSGFVRMLSLGSVLIAFILSWVIIAKPHMAKTLAVPYALCEGLFVGAISLVISRYYPTVAISAISATFITAAVMLALYRSGVVKVNEKFRSITISAMIAISLVYLVQIILSLLGSGIPSLFSGGLLAIGFSIFVVIIASLSLLMDFDNVEKARAMQISSEYEWVFGVGLVSTLVWMYVEFVRLIGYLQD